MQKPNQAELLAQRFLKLALLIQAGQKANLFNQAQHDKFAAFNADFYPFKIRIEDSVFDATIQKAGEIEGDPIAELEAALAVDQEINDVFWDIGLDAQILIEEIKADISKIEADDL